MDDWVIMSENHHSSFSKPDSENNYSDISKWYIKEFQKDSISTGYALKCIYSNNLYYNNNKEIKENLNNLIELESKGFKRAAYILGCIYYSDSTVRDTLESIKWFAKVDEYGELNAPFILGCIYMNIGR